jgi:hypothetical protein
MYSGHWLTLILVWEFRRVLTKKRVYVPAQMTSPTTKISVYSTNQGQCLILLVGIVSVLVFPASQDGKSTMAATTPSATGPVTCF